MTIVSWEFESPPLHLYCYLTFGNSSVGIAQPCQGWGRYIESSFPLKLQWRKLCAKYAKLSFFYDRIIDYLAFSYKLCNGFSS